MLLPVWLRVLATLLLACTGVVLAQESDNSSPLDGYPECAIGCIIPAIVGGLCQADDQNCTCNDETFKGNVSTCVAEACTVPEALTTQNVSATNCHEPVRNRSRVLYTISFPLIVFPGIFVAIRFIYKIWAGMRLGLDDWFIIVTMIVSVPCAVVNIVGVSPHGVGRDIWTVPHEDITISLRYFFITAMLYFFATATVKLSIVAFLLPIFPGKSTQWALWGTFVFISLWGSIFTLMAIFQCRPITYLWTQWHGKNEGTCLDPNAIAWSHASINIALELWIMAIPLWELRKLQLHWKKKVGVCLMFSVGIFVTIMSILRLRSIVQFSQSVNKTWEFLDVSIWSAIELTVAITCACLPALRLVFVRLFPVLGGGSTDSHHSGSYYNRQRTQTPGRGHSTRDLDPHGTCTSTHISARERRGSMGEEYHGAGISFKKTYAVQHTDGDEINLVQIHVDDKDASSDKSDMDRYRHS